MYLYLSHFAIRAVCVHNVSGIMSETNTYNDSKPSKALDNINVPPQSVEAEQSVLGGIMLDNEAFDRIAGRLSEANFYKTEHRLIYRVMASLARRNSPLDVLTIAEALKDIGELENAGGEIYLFELARNVPSASNISAYADIVRERATLRHLLGVAHEIADSAFNPDGRDANELLGHAEQKIFAIAEQNLREGGPVDLRDLLAEAVDKIDTLFHSDSPITGLPTGFSDFDDMTAGLQPGDLIIAAGRPSMGKTVFGMNIAEYAAVTSGKPVLVFSLEMPGSALAMRMMSSWGRIEQNKVRTGRLDEEDWPRITSAVSGLSEAKMFIDDTGGLSPAEMRSRARRIAKEQGDLGLIVVDYLQLMKIASFKENRTAEISEISRSLKMLAKELNVPVVALSQLNRSLEQRPDKRPIMSDLRESGSIEQDADVIAFIYRDEVYNPNTRDKGTAEIIIAKQRNGPIGKIRLTFLGQFTRFENYTPVSYEE